MKKTNYMVIALTILAILLMAACAQAPVTEEQNPTASSSQLGGGMEDNTLFGDGNATSQPTSGATAPSSGATVPSSGATQPATQATQPTSAPKDPAQMDYLTFQSLSGAEQRAFQESFESLDAFFAWYNAAKEAYENANPPIEVGGDGVVTLPTTP